VLAKAAWARFYEAIHLICNGGSHESHVCRQTGTPDMKERYSPRDPASRQPQSSQYCRPAQRFYFEDQLIMIMEIW